MKRIRHSALLLILFLVIPLWVFQFNPGVFSSQLPLGSEPTGTVPYFNLWTLRWNIQQAKSGYQNYWDTPIFYPARGTFAFSEPQPLTGLLAFVFNSPSTAIPYNGVLVFFMLLNGLLGYKLIRMSGIPPGPAVFGGLWLQTLPFLTHERGVLQLQPIFGMLTALISLRMLIKTSAWKWAFGLAASILITMLVSEYFGLILITAFSVMLPILLFQKHACSVKFMIGLLGGTGSAVILLLPQWRILADYGFRHSQASILSGSADLKDYLSPSSQTLIGWFAHSSPPDGLYPGILLALLALVGLWILFKDPSEQLLYYSLLLSSGLAAWLLSLGLNLKIGDWRPYTLLIDALPGFENLRSPFRFGVWVQIVLVIFAVQALSRTIAKNKILFVTLALFVMIENFPIPSQFAPLPQDTALSGVRSPAVFLPYVQGSSATAYTATTRWMLVSQSSGFAIINGYSGFFPEQNFMLKNALADFPDDESLNALEQIGVRTILFNENWLDAPHLDRLAGYLQIGRLQESGSQAGYLILEIP